MNDITCQACNEQPSNAVEAPCCGSVYCWECVVDARQCSCCGLNLSPEMCSPVNPIIANLIQNQRKPTPDNPAARLPHPHQMIACPEHCGEAVTYARMEEHLASCPEVFGACPKGCSVQIQRKLIAGHVEDFCPLTMVKCPYGCSNSMPRAELPAHLEGNVEVHLQQLAKRVQEQEDHIKEFNQRGCGLGYVCQAARCALGSVTDAEKARQFLKSHFPPATICTVAMFVLGLFMLSSLPLLIEAVVVFVCWRKYPWKDADNARMLFKVKAFVALVLLWVISQAPFWLLAFVIAPIVWLVYLSRQEIMDSLQRIINA